MTSGRRVFPISSPGKTWVMPAAAIAVMLVALAVIIVMLQSRSPAPTAAYVPKLVLSSHQFPMTVGNNTLRVQIVGADGAALAAESVRFDASSQHPGSLPLARSTTSAEEGIYSVMMTYPMTGAWQINITAVMADGSTLREAYDVFVYPVPPANNNPRMTYVSASELAAIPYDEARELRIVIPQGTRAGIVGGHGTDVIGDEIRLNVSGRNTLIIQNDDIADHNVGPFFVRAGETVRQEFRSPALYQGACSIRHGAEVNIIVDA